MSIETIKERIMNGDDLLNIEKLVYIQYSITEPSKGGKMDKIPSISTSALCNENCSSRSKNPACICSKCYARRDLSHKKTLRKKMECNTKFYTQYELTTVCIPLINNTVFRFESFGEIQNEIQVKNYFTIARKNKQCFFVLWTKEPGIIQTAKEKYNLRKPGNLRIIASEYFIDSHFAYDAMKKYKFVDKVFSVYTKDFAAENNININCFGKCIECMKCYDRENRERFINEYLK